jgi:hypothetical protein
MKNPFTATAPAAYSGSVAATLTVAAILGLAAGAKTAKAWDQQATEAAMSTEISHRAAPNFVPRRSWFGAYASARSHQGGVDSGGAQRDFQLEGR